MRKSYAKKLRLGTVGALGASLLCTLTLGLTGMFGGTAASAMTTANSSPTVGEIYGSGGAFNSDNLNELYKQLSGNNNATYSTIAGMGVTDSQALNANNGGKDIIVRFGGFDWTVTYLSKDDSGNPIATLWLADGGKEVAPWSAGWQANNGTVNYPSNMYSTSYIRSYLNGTPYAQAEGAIPGKTFIDLGTDAATINSSVTINTTGAQSVKWKAFLSDTSSYLVQPKNVAWQRDGLGERANGDLKWSTWGFDAPNSQLQINSSGADVADGSLQFYQSSTNAPYNQNYFGKGNNSQNTGYNSWGNDYLWIPATAETGLDDSRTGIWNTTQNQRQNDTGTSENFVTGNPGSYNYSWLRSGNISSAGGAYALTAGGSMVGYSGARQMAVRPALHLNLKAANEAKTTNPTVNEIYSGNGAFNEANVAELYKQLSGKNDATYATVSGMGVANSADINKNNGGQDIIVRFGGYNWTVTYLSKDDSGNTIATLWLDNGGKEVVPWAAGWCVSTGYADYPSSMYSTSYVRSYLNGTPYAQAEGAVAGSTMRGIDGTVAEINSKISINYSGAQANKWKSFLSDTSSYLVQPKNVAWQRDGLGEHSDLNWAGSDWVYDAPNSQLQINASGADLKDTGLSFLNRTSAPYNLDFFGKGNNAQNTGYNSWGSDYLWLPAMAETGYDASHIGLWNTTVAQRQNDTGTNENFVKGVPGLYNYSWLRSGYTTSTSDAYSLYTDGSNFDFWNPGRMLAVRPALHLNLTKIAGEEAEADLESLWNNAVSESLAGNGKLVEFTLPENWYASEDTTYTKSFGEGEGFSNGRLFVPDGANIKLNLNGYTIDRGLISPIDWGGVIYVEGKLEICDGSAFGTGKITGGYATGRGAGVLVTGGELTLTSGKITGNKAEDQYARGGGVYMDTGTTFTMNGGEVSYNQSSGGGGVYIYDGAKFYFNGGKISNNKSLGNGGGVFMAATEGLNNPSELIMTGGEVSGNYSVGNGGGILLGTQVNATITGGKVISNKTGDTKSGGGLYVTTGSTVEISGKAQFTGNSARDGGAIYCGEDNILEISDKVNISDNVATRFGGGVYTTGLPDGRPYTDGVKPCTLNISGGTISNNTATNGGGLWTYFTDVTISGGEISGNRSAAGGGVAFGERTLTITGGKIINNVSNAPEMGGSSGNGGGICFFHNWNDSTDTRPALDRNTLILDGGVISGNSATKGGGVSFVNGRFTLISGGISNNTAVTGNGGGIYFEGTTEFTMNGGVISGNSAVAGGGMYLSSQYTTFTMNGGVISGNTASENGGGMHLNGAIFKMYGGVISGNSTEGAGGGVYAKDATFDIYDGTFTENSATRGGALNVYGGALNIYKGSFLNNEGSIYAGALYATSLVVTLEDCEMHGNTGHAIYANNGATLNIKGGRITGNAYGVFVHAQSTVNISGGIINDNDGRNVYLPGNTVKVNIVGPLFGNGKVTNIGFSVENSPRVFTVGYGTDNSVYAPSTFFFSDNKSFLVTSSGSGSATEAIYGTLAVQKTLVWKYTTDGTNYTVIEDSYINLPYTGATYTVKAFDGTTEVSATATSVSTGGTITTVSNIGSYAYIINNSSNAYANPTLNFVIEEVEVVWKISTDGGATWREAEDVIYYTGLTYTVGAFSEYDGSKLTIQNSAGAAKNAGEYEYRITTTGYSNRDYKLTIKTRKLEIVWNFGTALTEGGDMYWDYDGMPHAPVAVIKGLDNEQVGNFDLVYEYVIAGMPNPFGVAQSRAGEYTLTVQLASPDTGNIELANTVVNYSIKPLSISLQFKDEAGNVVTDAAEYTYDGNTHMLYAVVTGLIGQDTVNVNITYSKSGVQLAASAYPTDAGKYLATAKLAAGTSNYVLDNNYTCQINISQKTAQVTFTGNPDKAGTFLWTFNGQNKTPTVQILDVSGNTMAYTPEYAAVISGVAGSFSTSRPVNAGKYVMRVTINNANYVLSASEQEFEIEKLGVALNWNISDGTYSADGKTVRWEYDGVAHNVVPEINGVDAYKDGNFGPDLKLVRTDIYDVLKGVGTATAVAELDTSDAYNANFYITNAKSLNYEVYKKVLTRATFTETYAGGGNFSYTSNQKPSYDYGVIKGANGPAYTATATGVKGDLTLTVTYPVSFTGDWAVDATTGYKAVATLSATDYLNYEFTGGKDSVELTFYIRSISGTKENITVVWEMALPGGTFVNLDDYLAANPDATGFVFTYNGNTQCPVAWGVKADGTRVSLALSANSSGKDAGDYTAILLPSGEYNIPQAQYACEYTIAPLDVTIEWQNAIDDNGKDFVYTYSGSGDEKAPYAIVSGNGSIPCPVTVTGATNAGKWVAVATVDKNFNITGDTDTCDFTINKMGIGTGRVNWAYDGATLVNGVNSWIYNGDVRTPTASVTVNGVTLDLIVTGGSSQVGTHYAYAMLDNDNPDHSNYKLTDTVRTQFAIIRITTGTVYWSNDVGDLSEDGAVALEFTYNGSAQKPTAYFVNDKGDNVPLEVQGDGWTDTGTYTAYVTGDFDFGGVIPQCSVVIKAKPLTVVWSDTSVQYNGGAQRPTATVTDADLAYTLVYGTDYTVTEFTEAGKHKASITFKDANYTYAPSTDKVDFTITKINLSSVLAWDFVTDNWQGNATDGYYLPYDANTHAPELTGTYTLGTDAVTFTYTYTGVVASAGTHTVTATIATATWNGKDISANFTLGTAAETDYTITPHEITIRWDFTTDNWQGDATNGYYLPYDGDAHAPKAFYTDWTNTEKEITTVYGAEKNARKAAYTAKVLVPENCVFAAGEDGEQEYFIGQATIDVMWEAAGATLVDGKYVWEYDGNEHRPLAYIKKADGTKGDPLSVTAAEKDAGEYTAECAQDDGNYVIATGGEQDFVIEEKEVYVKWYGKDGTQVFTWQFDDSASAKAVKPTAKLCDVNGDLIKGDDGNDIEVEVTGEMLTVGEHTAQAVDSFRNYKFHADAENTKTFKIDPKSLSSYNFDWTENPANATVTNDGKYDVYTYQYNGGVQSPVPTVQLSVQLETTIVKLNSDGTEGETLQAITDIGSYLIKVKSLNGNYAVPADKETVKVVITVRKVTVVWSTDTQPLTYNGMDQAPTAYYEDVDGTVIDLDVTVTGQYQGGYSQAHEGYVAVASFKDANTANYVLDDKTETTTYDILQREIPVSWNWAGTWTDKKAEYDTENHTPRPVISLKNLYTGDMNYVTPSYEIVKDGKVVSTNGYVKDAGQYAITVKLSGDKAGNYKLTTYFEQFEITKKTLTIVANDEPDVKYGQLPPAYSATFTGFAGDEDETSLGLAAIQNQWLRCSYTSSSAPGDYPIGLVQARLTALLPNYDVQCTNGTLTVSPVARTVIWYNFSTQYDGTAKKPSAEYFETVGSTPIVLEVVYATYDDGTGEYTEITDATYAAINAGTYYAIAKSANGNVALNNDRIPFTIAPREITVNIESRGVAADDTIYFGEVYKDTDGAGNETGELVLPVYLWSYGTDVRPVGNDDLAITLLCNFDLSADFDAYGYANAGAYRITGSWSDDEMIRNNYSVTFVGDAEDAETGANSVGTYKISLAKISVPELPEKFSNEEFEVRPVVTQGTGYLIRLGDIDADTHTYSHVFFSGNQDADNVKIYYSRIHNIGVIDNLLPSPAPAEGVDVNNLQELGSAGYVPTDPNYYRTYRVGLRDVGCYAVNYIILIPNHEPLLGTWRVYMTPEEYTVRVVFEKPYEITYGEDVPEDLAKVLLSGGYIDTDELTVSPEMWNQNATARVVDNHGRAINNFTGVGDYNIIVEVANPDSNVELLVIYHAFGKDVDTSLGAFKIVPKQLSVNFGEVKYTYDGALHVPDLVIDGWITADTLTLHEIDINNAGGIMKTVVDVTDNGAHVRLIVTATGDFTSVGGNTLRVESENPNYVFPKDQDVTAVTILNKVEDAEFIEGLPDWLMWVLIAAGVLLFILIIVIVVVVKKKRAAADDDGFYDDVTEEDQAEE